jgi:hypothetical protein
MTTQFNSTNVDHLVPGSFPLLRVVLPSLFYKPLQVFISRTHRDRPRIARYHGGLVPHNHYVYGRVRSVFLIACYYSSYALFLLCILLVA